MKNSVHKKVKDRIDEYIGFDSDILFKCGDLKIFGGAVRDSIADMEIHDIDIMCGAHTANMLHDTITKMGFVYNDKISMKGTSELYKGIKVINEPKTYIKDNKYIQLIRPVGTASNTYEIVANRIDTLISNVDISCCGISYDNNKLSEKYPNSIIHSICKIFMVNDNAEMKLPSRIYDRISKLKKRGWEQMWSEEEALCKIREIQISRLNE